MSDLDPQCRSLLDAMDAVLPKFDWQSVSASEVRPTMEGPSVFGPGDDVASVEELQIQGPGGPLRLRVFRPKVTGMLPLTVYVHGGGFVCCRPENYDNVCRCLAARANTVVVSVDYRRAPESKFPAAVDDAWAALEWARRHGGEVGGDITRLAVAGDSAGGALAAVTAIHARDAGLPLRRQLLLYPVTSARCEGPSFDRYGEGHLLSTGMMRWFWRQYLVDPAQALDPRAAPLEQTRLSGVAPATVVLPGFDPLNDEGRAYALRLRDAGVPVQVHEWPGQIHGFASLLGAVDAADRALHQAAASLRAAWA